MSDDAKASNGNGATVKLNVSGLVQAIALAALLGAGSYTWVNLQRVPDPEVIRSLQADILQVKLDTVRSQASIATLDTNMAEIKAHLAEIERLLRVRARKESERE